MNTSPAPSFAVNPRPDELRLAVSDFGDRLGTAPSDAGSVSSLGLDGGSMHVHLPASEAGSRATDEATAGHGSRFREDFRD